MRKISILLFILFCFGFFSSSLFSWEIDSEALNSFQVSPKRTSQFIMIRSFHNPVLNKYVVFMYEIKGTDKIVWSRSYNKKGKAAGPFIEVVGGPLSWADVVYNEIEDVFFFIWSDHNQDVIRGKLLDGTGEAFDPADQSDRTKQAIIKNSTGTVSAIRPRAAWLCSVNEYGIGWYSQRDAGHMFTSFNSDLKRITAPKKVRFQCGAQPQLGNITTLISLPDRLFWGTADNYSTRPGDHRFQPAVFFTDLSGNVFSHPQKKDEQWMIYPGDPAGGEGYVYADYNPSSQRFLLAWTVSDHPRSGSQSYKKSFFRIMDSDGNFLTKTKRLNRTKYSYQGSAEVLYNPLNDKFFVVWPEYKFFNMSYVLSFFPDGNNVVFSAGKLFARSINHKGKFADKPKPLLDKITGLYRALVFSYHGENVVHNAENDHYLISYNLENFIQGSSSLKGLIFEAQDMKKNRNN